MDSSDDDYLVRETVWKGGNVADVIFEKTPVGSLNVTLQEATRFAPCNDMPKLRHGALAPPADDMFPWYDDVCFALMTQDHGVVKSTADFAVFVRHMHWDRGVYRRCGEIRLPKRSLMKFIGAVGIFSRSDQ